MSAQTMADAFAPVGALYREQVMQQTWGHLAPRKSKKYWGTIVFTFGLYNSGNLNPTFLKIDLKGLDDSPWFCNAVIDWVYESMIKNRDLDDNSHVGGIYEFSGYFMNYKFIGKTNKIWSAYDPQSTCRLNDVSTTGSIRQ